MKHIISCLVLIGLFGCDNSNSGDVTYFREGTEKLEYGKIISMWVNYELEDGDKLIETQPEEPLAMRFDSATVEERGLIQGILATLKVGDSVFFEIPAKNLWEKSFRQDLPDSIRETSLVKVSMGIVNQFTQQEWQAYGMEREQKKNQVYFDQEKADLKNFIDATGLDITITESGLGYIIHEEGSGPKAKNEDVVNVKYAGRTLNGNLFDQGDYQFILGRGGVIGGWDEGIALLQVGSKATLYIPSNLGYGSRGSGPNIPPFSSLIFEVELLEIKDQ